MAVENTKIKIISAGGKQYEIDAKTWNGLSPSAKQDKLTSGSNIKTINDESILGAGNIKIDGVYVWDITPLSITSGKNQAIGVTANILKEVYNNYLEGKPIYIYDGIGILPTFVDVSVLYTNDICIYPYTVVNDYSNYNMHSIYSFDKDILYYDDDTVVYLGCSGTLNKTIFAEPFLLHNSEDVDTTTIPFTCGYDNKLGNCYIHTITYGGGETFKKQFAHQLQSESIYTRTFDSDVWSDWIEITSPSYFTIRNYFTCSTSATTAKKTISSPGNRTLSSLNEGDRIWVNFSKGNSYMGKCTAKILNIANIDLCLNGQSGNSNDINTYTCGIKFNPGVYELIYLKDSSGTAKLHFTGNNYIDYTVSEYRKNPYINVVATATAAQLNYTLASNIHTVFDIKNATILNVSCNGDCSFEFETGENTLTFGTPNTWKWANGVSPIIKTGKKYHVSVVNNCAVIVEFS